MKKSKSSAAQRIGILRQIDGDLSVAEASRQHGIRDETIRSSAARRRVSWNAYVRWRMRIES